MVPWTKDSPLRGVYCRQAGLQGGAAGRAGAVEGTAGSFDAADGKAEEPRVPPHHWHCWRCPMQGTQGMAQQRSQGGAAICFPLLLPAVMLAVHAPWICLS